MTAAGPGGLPPLRLRSWAEVVQHVADGNLNEARRVEHKEMPSKASQGASLEIARDVASLTVDGGWLIYGIKDRDQLQVEDVVGVGDPEKVRTRVGNIAIAQIHPPVSLDGEVLIDPNNPERGLVVFSVPASPLAPHMADGKFWGRGDREKVPLSEAAVARLYAQRQAAQASIGAELDRLAREFDPLVTSLRTGRFMIVVRPDTLQPAAQLSEHLGDTYFPTLVNELVAFNPKHVPVFGSPQQGVGDSEGIAFDFWPSTGTEADVEEGAVRAIIHDNGTLWWLGSSTERFNPMVTRQDPDGSPRESMQMYQLINADRIMEVLHSATQFTAGLVSDRLGYRGAWTVAVRLTKLAGVRNHTMKAARGDGGHPFRLTSYQQVTQTSTTEMLEQPSKVVGRLVERLLRGVGVKDLYLPYDDPAKIGERVRWTLH